MEIFGVVQVHVQYTRNMVHQKLKRKASTGFSQTDEEIFGLTQVFVLLD
jgi:hypothetical protein